MKHWFSNFTHRCLLFIVCLITSLSGFAWTQVTVEEDGVTYIVESSSIVRVTAISAETAVVKNQISYDFNGRTYTRTVNAMSLDAPVLKNLTLPNTISFKSDSFVNAPMLESVTVDGIVYYVLADQSSGLRVLIKDKKELVFPLAPFPEAYTINIPEGVTDIRKSAFEGCSGLTSVIIPNSVTEIGHAAFSNCTGLTSVIIPNSVTSISDYTFYNCRSLTSVNIGNSVTSIGEGVFEGCSGLTSVIVPNSVTSIGASAFSGCSGLKTLVIEDGDTELNINLNAFTNAPIEDLTIGRNWNYPEKKAMTTGITKLTLTNGVTAIPDYAFSGCTGLTSVIIPNSVTSISDYTFYNCRSLTSVTIGNSVTNIGASAFEGCTGLTSVIIPNSVTSIGISAFEGCTGLESVNIPNSVTEIGHSAFSNCTGLTSVTIPNSVTSIGNATFFHCNSLTSVTIGNSVTSIGANAFYYCTGLTSIDIPNSVTEISNSAFDSCSGLTSVIIPNSVTSIGADAFVGCSGLTSVIIGNSVTSIGANAFEYCRSLKKSAYPNTLNNPFGYGVSISYPAEGAEIEDGFVYGPNKSAIYFAPLSLEGEYIIPNSVTSIGESAFRYCDSLTSVTIPNSVTSISDNTFYNCSGLTSVIIPNSVTSIGSDAFSQCYSLEKSAFPNTLSNPFYSSYIIPDDPNAYTFDLGIAISYPAEGSEIEDGFVYGPNKSAIYFAPLSFEGEYTIPNSVTSIGESAFSGCSGITEVVSPFGAPAAMHDSSFEGLYDKATLVVPEDAIYNYLATNWSLFKNLTDGNQTTASSYADGVLSYRLIPAANESEQNTAVVISGDYASLTEVSIPERFSDPDSQTRYYVSGIGYGAFKNCSNLKTISFNRRSKATVIGDYAFAGTGVSIIELPATVEAIGDYAFANTGITSMAFPEALETIGNYAFYGCSSLNSTVFDDNLTSIGDYGFSGCNLTTVTFNRNLSKLGTGAFQNNRNLKNVEWNTVLTYVPDYCFNGCTKLEWPINPANDLKIESIGKSAFDGCNNLGTVAIPATVTSIGADAFRSSGVSKVITPSVADWSMIEFGNPASNPASLAGDIYITDAPEAITDLMIPEVVEQVNSYAFRNCRSIKSVSLPNTLKAIGDNAFEGLEGIETLVLPNSLAEIGTDAFDGCTSLRDIILGRSLKTINANSFTGCNFYRLTIADGTDKLTFVGSWNDIKVSDLYMGRQFESTDGFRAIKNLTVGNVVAEISSAQFKGFPNLTTVTLGSGLKTIGDEAFGGLTGMEEIIVPPSVETIGASAFAGNSALKSIIMGHSVKTIGEKAFDGCPASTVSITAQTPPTAPNNTFSNYTGKLYLQGEDAVDAYYDAFTCWDRFDGYVMIEPTEMQLDGDKKLIGKPGDTFQLTAKLMPEGVSLPQIFWRSTNPDIATVDANGLVTLHADLDEVMMFAEGDENGVQACKIIAESLYADGPVAEVEVNSNISTGVTEVTTGGNAADGIDYAAPYEVYNLNGLRVSEDVENLATGIYIVRQGKNVQKIAVK